MRVFSLITLCTLTACDSLFGHFIGIENCDSSGVNCQSSDGFQENTDASTIDDLSTLIQDMSNPADDLSGPAIPPNMIKVNSVPGFIFGDPTNTTGGNDFPTYTKTISSFYLDQNEVSTLDYYNCTMGIGTKAGMKCIASPKIMQECNLFTVPRRDDHPINCVTFGKADEYCKAVGKRLPTDEEWEVAAAGPYTGAGNKGFWPWGNTQPATITLTTFLCYNIPTRTTTCQLITGAPLAPPTYTLDGVLYTGADKSKAFVNLFGNVKEWTSTPYCEYSITGCNKNTDQTRRIIRGGSFQELDTKQLRNTFRTSAPLSGFDESADNRGFRCAYPPQ